jgi:hypothetical protein
MAAVLANLVNYQDVTDPKDYIQCVNNGYNIFRNTLKDHLQGTLGASTGFLEFGCARRSFNKNAVRLGLTPACPMPMRQQIIAQHNYRANENCILNNNIPPNEDSIRITNLMAATLGVILSLTYRIVRIVLRTLFLPVTFLYALHQENKYQVEGWAVEDLRRISWEWIDGGIIFISFFSGIINTFHPNAINLDSIRDYYIERIDYAIEGNQRFAQQKYAYYERKAAIRANETSESHANRVQYDTTG